MPHVYDFARPAVTVDVIALRLQASVLQVLTTRRKEPPFRGRLALPGTFVHDTETLDDAATRVLRDKANLSGVYLEQLYTFGALKRDPRDRVISVAYLAILAADAIEHTTGRWIEADEPPALAFDHKTILATAIERLDAKLSYSSIGLRFLPARFTRAQAQTAYEALLGQTLDKRNFAKQFAGYSDVVDTGEKKTGGAHRPAQLFELADRNRLTY
ncbi:MAG: NUDIX domain-containing protein [Gammaproteobacteria bacterium]